MLELWYGYDEVKVMAQRGKVSQCQIVNTWLRVDHSPVTGFWGYTGMVHKIWSVCLCLFILSLDLIILRCFMQWLCCFVLSLFVYLPRDTQMQMSCLPTLAQLLLIGHCPCTNKLKIKFNLASIKLSIDCCTKKRKTETERVVSDCHVKGKTNNDEGQIYSQVWGFMCWCPCDQYNSTVWDTSDWF